MRVSEQVLKTLAVSEAVSSVTAGHLDRFPPLILDQCLQDAHRKLTEQVVSWFRSGHVVHAETLTMPRKGFGPRPVTIISPGARAMYSALVDKLAPTLPHTSRGSEEWARHEKFGMPDTDTSSEYLVEFDIAACYEYVDHGALQTELMVHSMNAPVVEHVAALLGEMFGRPRGLPQLLGVSDILADAYLEVIERALLRSGYEVSRYADDFKVLAPDWARANGAIEDAAEIARASGLILSSEKTKILKASTLAARQREREAFLVKYFQEAKDALTTIDPLLFGDYGEVGVTEVEPGAAETLQEALRRIIGDWIAMPTDEMSVSHVQFVPGALFTLRDATQRIPDDWLSDIVFRQPLRLENVAQYLLSRDEPEANWRSLARLTRMERQSPWAKIWLLHVANEQGSGTTPEQVSVHEWAKSQLKDRHETVRSEAAWFLSGRCLLGADAIPGLYRAASSISRPTIAAASARQGLKSSDGLAKAMCSDSPLIASAFSWATSA